MTSNLQHESRQFVRVPFAAPVQAEQIPQPSPNRIWHLLPEDLSESGLRLLSPELFPVKSRLLLDLDSENPGSSIRAVGRVVWASQLPDQDEWHIGIEFSELSDSCRARVREKVMEQQASG